MKPTLLPCLALFTALCAAHTAHAATIAWGAPQNIVGNSDVETTGTLVRAFDLGNFIQGAPINGVLFGAHGGASGTVGNFAFNFPGGGFADTNIPNGLSPEYFAMVKGGSQMGITFNTSLITMNNLTLGATYDFQWWSNLGFNTGDYRTQADGAAGLDANLSGLLGGTGQYQIGTFTATSLSQTVTFTGGGTPTSSGITGIISGFQLAKSPPSPSPARRSSAWR